MRQLRPIQEHNPYIERYRGTRSNRIWLLVIAAIIAAVAALFAINNYDLWH